MRNTRWALVTCLSFLLVLALHSTGAVRAWAPRSGDKKTPPAKATADKDSKKKKETVKETKTLDEMTDEEFEKHWLYVRPERMHEGAIEGVTAYRAAQD